jgi:hypothetical protein
VDSVLRGVLESSSFNSSKQCQTLLRYLVEQSGQTKEESLKERVIGMEVFGRQPDYNTGDDPIVRARVGEVRKRLAQYYLSEEGSRAKVQIAIPSGSYRVTLRSAHKELPSEAAASDPKPYQPVAALDHTLPSPSTRQTTERTSGTSILHLGWACGIGCLILIFVLILFFRSGRPQAQEALDQFWEPLFQGPKPVLIYTGTNLVFSPSESLRIKLLKQPRDRGQSAGQVPFLAGLAPSNVLTAQDVHPVNYEYTTIGDMAAGMKLAQLLTSHHHNFDVRGGEDISVGDLRNSPSILIGGSNNFWTLELARKLPVSLIVTPGGQSKFQDSKNDGNVWVSSLDSEAANGEDFALVVRLLDSQTGNPVIIIAGITSFGTKAAGQFVTNADALRALAKSAPKGWANKNLEIVLRTEVLKNDPGAATVVAARYW